MAVTKFKITRLPQRAVVKIETVNAVLDQEYHISKEAAMTVDVGGRGVPYDDFGFKLGNDNGNWSTEYKATVNAEVNTDPPNVPDVDLIIYTLGIMDITASIVPNDSTDRVKFNSIGNYGRVYINGTIVTIGKTYFGYELIQVIFNSTADLTTQNVVSVLEIAPGNINGFGTPGYITITTSGNLHGSAGWDENEVVDEDFDNITGNLTAV